jgi:GDP-mannose transporter
MSFYNNLLSLPLVLVLMALTGEALWCWGEPALRRPGFLAYSTLGGFFGYAISFTSIWYVSVTTATLYSLTGSMNKVLVAVVGIWMFDESTSPNNLGSIAIGLAAGGLLPYIKMRQTGGGGGAGGGG